MTFLEEVHAKRRKLADVLADEDYSGIREIVEQLYPDRAHFIYELLQNAEDTKARQAKFQLTRNCLSFEHNGRPFDEKDVWRITNIGRSSKREELDKIGRFGVGFKAVFAYSETPHIWSKAFSFKITDLVLPVEIDRPKQLPSEGTYFEFPFNNPKKSADAAYREIEAGLNELAETTLLFLSSLNLIRWQIGRNATGEVRRVQHSERHFEIVKQSGSSRTSSHFLKFEQPVEGLEAQRVAIAFALDFLPACTKFDPSKSLSKQLKVIPAERGRVAVFFPAEKETSGLRFHLHAPFVPELSRASIKETPANAPLFRQLALLGAASLHGIRDLGLLSVDFLSVLPNSQDEQVPPRYQCIRAAIVDEMNRSPLTPTHDRSHLAASRLLQAKASLKDLLSDGDLEFLASSGVVQPRWAVGVTQRNSNADRFLAGLAITQWDIEQFVALLSAKTSEGAHYSSGRWVSDPDPEFMAWLSGKPMEWHQRLYSLLYSELSPNGNCGSLSEARIVRLSDETYSTGARCFFPSEDVRQDEALPRVHLDVYSSGKSKTQQENARKLLEALGVRLVGEAEQIEAILKQRYTAERLKPQKQDLKRFINLVEKDSTQVSLFRDFFIFEGRDGKWTKPADTFLDEPFLDTGLTAYYDAFGERAARVPLAVTYADFGISLKRIAKFAETIGSQTQLEIAQVGCRSNPQYPYLLAVPGERYTSPIDRDFVVPGLQTHLAKPTVSIARLIWRTMCALPSYPDRLKAAYRKSGSGGTRYADSLLVDQLRKAAWIPQGNEVFVRPEDALPGLLPDGFPFDSGAAWLKAVGFARAVEVKSEEQQHQVSIARQLGFKDQAGLERAKRFAALPSEEQERILQDLELTSPTELPENMPGNPERRAARVGSRASTAPERGFDNRMRSVSVGGDEVKQQAAQYLRQQYSNLEGDMICQICKSRLPFKLDDGNDYFEAVEFLRELRRRHYQNYLALCPNHSAMFQYTNGSLDSLERLFVGLAGNELDVVLARTEVAIYFTKTHIADLKEVIRVDRAVVGMPTPTSDDRQRASSSS